MRLLHVYAGPFPSAQGTQTLIGQLCRLQSEAGHEVHLLAYAHAGFPRTEPFTVHRIPDLPRFDSTRSGPAWQRPLLDLSLARSCRRLAAALEPDVVHAHHAEALAACRLADRLKARPLVYHLHALLGPELPTYVPWLLAPLARRLGEAVDTGLPALADGAVALEPRGRDHLVRAGLAPGRICLARPPAEPLPVPAPPPRAPGAPFTAAYTGNLDRYQGLDGMLAALGRVREPTASRLRVEVITDSHPGALLARVDRVGLADMVRVVPHGSFEEAWARTAAADLVIVPRRRPGGVPIKLVNALAAGLPCLVDRRMVEDGPLPGHEVWAVDMGDPRATAAAIERLAGDELLRHRLAQGALAAARRLHDPAAGVAAIDALYARLLEDR